MTICQNCGNETVIDTSDGLFCTNCDVRADGWNYDMSEAPDYGVPFLGAVGHHTHILIKKQNGQFAITNVSDHGDVRPHAWRPLHAAPPAPRPIKPCPFCDDPMKIDKSGLLMHVEQGNCIIGQLSFPSDRAATLQRWQDRPTTEAQ